MSRCLQFNLKNISPERLVEHIKHILDEEKIPYEEPALWQLGRAAQGSVRDCLTLLDQAIGYCEGNITDAEVSTFLGAIDQGVIHNLVDALVAEDAAAMLEIIENVANYAPDFAAVLTDLQSYLHRVAIAQAVPNGVDNSHGDRKQVKEHAGKIPAETVQLYYQVALKAREDMAYAIDARSGLEMALLRMLAFTPARAAAASGAGPDGNGDSADSAKAVKKKPVANEKAASQAASAPKPANPKETTVAVKSHREPAAMKAPAPAAPVVSSELVQSHAEVSSSAHGDLNKSKISITELKPSSWINLFLPARP